MCVPGRGGEYTQLLEIEKYSSSQYCRQELRVQKVFLSTDGGRGGGGFFFYKGAYSLTLSIIVLLGCTFVFLCVFVSLDCDLCFSVVWYILFKIKE